MDLALGESCSSSVRLDCREVSDQQWGPCFICEVFWRSRKGRSRFFNLQILFPPCPLQGSIVFYVVQPNTPNKQPPRITSEVTPVFLAAELFQSEPQCWTDAAVAEKQTVNTRGTTCLCLLGFFALSPVCQAAVTKQVMKHECWMTEVWTMLSKHHFHFLYDTEAFCFTSVT